MLNIRVTHGVFPTEVGWTLACDGVDVAKGGAPYYGAVAPQAVDANCTLWQTDTCAAHAHTRTRTARWGGAHELARL
eukprot:31423-Prymnesium_polylepis.1